MKFKVIPANSNLPSGAWLVVIFLAVGGCLNYLDRIMITTMRPSIMNAIPMTEAQFGLLTSVFSWVYGILSPFAGFLADKVNRSSIIIGSVCLWSAVTWMTGYSTTFGELLTTRVLMGFSEALLYPGSTCTYSGLSSMFYPIQGYRNINGRHYVRIRPRIYRRLGC